MLRALLLIVANGCALQQPPSARPAASEPIAIIASERGPHGLRLVAIDEHGDRRFEVVVQPQLRTQDKNPAISPDGRWVVFASTRDRSDNTTSLWLAPMAAEAIPHRVTDGPTIDAQPVWTPDGRAVVFARADATGFDLWRIAIARDGSAGALEQLTHEPDHEVQPTIAADGTIVYASVSPIGDRGATESRLVERAPDGTLHVLTGGPKDSSPAFSPDGKTLVFARTELHAGEAQQELWRLTWGTQRMARLVALPITEESGPVWSRDGRFVFATSVFRGDRERALFSSVIHVDLYEREPRARILRDRAGANERLTPAVAAHRLDVAALHSDPEYLPELARIMAKKVAEQVAP